MFCHVMIFFTRYIFWLHWLVRDHTSPRLSKLALQHSDRSTAYGVSSLSMPCWSLFVPSWSARLTIESSFSPEFLVVLSTGCCLSRKLYSAGFLGEEVRAHNAIASWAPLAKSSGANPVPATRSRISLPSGHSTATPRREPSQDHRNHCSLLVPSTWRATLGDRAFPVATPRLWNTLSTSVRTAAFLQIFWRELKTLLIQMSFG